MKVKRSTKCSLRFANRNKQDKLSTVLLEYGKVVNIFISFFWKETPEKRDLLKPLVDIPETGLSARLRKVAAREAIDMINSSKKRWGDEAKIPVHKCKRMYLSSSIADLELSNTNEFDAWLKLRCIGNKVKIDLPIRFHRHYNLLSGKGRRLNSYIVTKDYVQLVFEIETGTKKLEGKLLGLDSGINALATTSDGKQYGTDIKSMINRVKRCNHGSNGQKKARRALYQRMNEVAKEVTNKDTRLLVVERLREVNKNSKKKRRVGKSTRKSLGIWAYRYWLGKLKRECEDQRLVYRSVSPHYTSQTCSKCGHIQRENRSGSKFKCLDCGYETNADYNASLNILERFLIGQYGADFKTNQSTICT